MVLRFGIVRSNLFVATVFTLKKSMENVKIDAKKESKNILKRKSNE